MSGFPGFDRQPSRSFTRQSGGSNVLLNGVQDRTTACVAEDRTVPSQPAVKRSPTTRGQQATVGGVARTHHECKEPTKDCPQPFTGPNTAQLDEKTSFKLNRPLRPDEGLPNPPPHANAGGGEAIDLIKAVIQFLLRLFGK